MKRVRGGILKRPLRRGLAALAALGAVVTFQQTPAIANPSPPWIAENVPVPGPGLPFTPPSITADSCPTKNLCIAVGSYGMGGQASGDDNLVNQDPILGVAETVASGSTSLAILPTPPGGDDVHLTAISCTSPDFCVAVGTYVSGGSLFLAEVFAGGTWSATPLPTVPVDPLSVEAVPTLNAISCTSSTTCEAVGQVDNHPIVDTLSGNIWTTTTLMTPASDILGVLTGISCASETTCQAVGYYDAGSNLMVETLSGSNWTAQALPVPNESSGPVPPNAFPVSCASATSCVAVSDYFDIADSSGTSVVEMMTGNTWSVVPPPNSASAVGLSGVSCPVVGACFFVGVENVANDPGGLQLFDDTLFGTTWAQTNLPAPPQGIPSLNPTLPSLTCNSTTSCMVTASDFVSGNGGTFLPFAETFTLGNWVALSLALPEPAPDASLSAVSCASPQSCVAVGWSVTPCACSGYTVTGFAEVLSDGSWQFAPLPLPNDAVAFGQQFAISCPTTIFCMAVGTYFPGGDASEHPLAEIWNQGVWNPIAMPIGAKAVSCATSTYCVALGGASEATWDAGTWRVARIATAHANISLDSVSCPSSTSCVAVGFHLRNIRGTGPAGFPVEATLSDGRWKWKNLHYPYGTPANNVVFPVLTSVWCASVTSCIATGAYTQLGGSIFPFAEVLSDGRWIPSTLPTFADNSFTLLNSISCTAMTSCSAVGDANGAPFADSLLQGSWVPDAISEPTPDTSMDMQSVSCPSLAVCVAVGSAFGIGGIVPVTAHTGALS